MSQPPLAPRANCPWTEEDDALLRSRYPTEPTAAVAAALGRKPSTVRARACDLGIGKVDANRPWSAADDAALIARYPFEAAASLARDLGRGKPALYARAHELGVRKGGVRHHAPGYVAHNAMPVGAERIGVRGTVFVKVGAGGWPDAWRAKHLLTWEAAHGPVPPGHMLTFRDRNPGNPDLANLELACKATWIARFIPERTLPPALAQLVRLRAVLVRKINQHNKQDQSDDSSDA